MLGRRGQAFDAFKLLIAAVVAGAILVIILSMLGGFVTPSGDPVTVMAQAIQGVKNSPYAGTLSTQVAQFQRDQVFSTKTVESRAGVSYGSVFFCLDKGTGISDGTNGAKYSCSESIDTICPPDYRFDTNTKKLFEVTSNVLKAKSRVEGRIWVYNCDGEYFIGFTTKKS